jgi:hypothetical protein
MGLGIGVGTSAADVPSKDLRGAQAVIKIRIISNVGMALRLMRIIFSH